MNLSNESDAKDIAKEFNLIDLDSNEYKLIGKEKKAMYTWILVHRKSTSTVIY